MCGNGALHLLCNFRLSALAARRTRWVAERGTTRHLSRIPGRRWVPELTPVARRVLSPSPFVFVLISCRHFEGRRPRGVLPVRSSGRGTVGLPPLVRAILRYWTYLLDGRRFLISTLEARSMDYVAAASPLVPSSSPSRTQRTHLIPPDYTPRS